MGFGSLKRLPYTPSNKTHMPARVTSGLQATNILSHDITTELLSPAKIRFLGDKENTNAEYHNPSM